MSSTKKVNLPAILDREIPDLAIPEPVSGSLFQRRTHVECIDSFEFEEYLTVGMVYRIEDVLDNDYIYVINDSGNVYQYPNRCFRSIEHGPFSKGDDVQLLNAEDIEVVNAPDNYTYSVLDYVGYKGPVIKATDTHSDIQVRAGLNFRVANRSLKYIKRHTMLKKNPFKLEDKVKCVKAHRLLSLGSLYTVSNLDGDWLYFREFDGERFRYNMFLKWDRPTKTQLKVKKYKARMKLSDHVRYYINRKFPTGKHNLSYIHKLMLEDKIISEDVSLKDIKMIYDQMFSWK